MGSCTSSPTFQAVEAEVFDMIKTIAVTDLNLALNYISSFASKNISPTDRSKLLNIVGVIAGASPVTPPDVPVPVAAAQ